AARVRPRIAGRDAEVLRVFAAALGPALAVALVTRWTSGGAPLRDLDIRLLGTGAPGGLGARIAETLRADADLAARGWPLLLAIATLLVLGRGGGAAGRRIVILGAASLSVYLVIPVLSVRGPRWLAESTLPRTSAALAPLAAAGIAAGFARRGAGAAPRGGG
ncbi:MAG TPA: hypothetical protein VIZ69_06555, partial [Thermoanaerobaculia bacterium]